MPIPHRRSRRLAPAPDDDQHVAARLRFEDAERRLYAEYGLVPESRRLALADPALGVRVLEAGAGEPVVVVLGSGMSASTWAPLLAHLGTRRTWPSTCRASGSATRMTTPGVRCVATRWRS